MSKLVMYLLVDASRIYAVNVDEFYDWFLDRLEPIPSVFVFPDRR